MPNKFYVTTPIYYVNDKPHIGHAYTTIAADVLARHYRNKGVDTFFLTGTDEHGAKIAEAAEKKGQTPQEFVDGLVPIFKNAWEKLNISYGGFIRTTNPEHEKIVRQLVEAVKDNGYIEKRKYEGLYCVGCERYLTEDELADGKCPDHKREPVLQSEENYFFLLSKAAKDFDLAGKIQNDEIKVRPEARKNEVLGKIKAGLEDVSISRENVAWGIPFPGDEKQTIYVWIDALINYYSATYIFDKAATWPANLHLMAKDILWFHAIIWPAFLMAANLETPKEVFAHGFFTIDGQKMSKSIGNIIDPIAEVDKYGNADVLRYALLREFPFGEDGDITAEKIASRYKNDLGNDLGNLLQRTISLINRSGFKVSDVNVQIQEGKFQHADGKAEKTLDEEINESIEKLEFSLALTYIWTSRITPINKYIDEKKPWELVKLDDKSELLKVLQVCYFNLNKIVENIAPFMPETSEKMQKQLKTLEPEPLFPRIEQ